jgi:integrase
MRVCDVDTRSNPMHITLTSHKEKEPKSRTIALTFQTQYLKQYMQLVSDKKPTDKLWIGVGRDKNIGAVLTTPALTQIITRASISAGIKRHVVPYLFRHTHLTWCYTHLPLEMAKYRAGHSKNSREASVYTHFAIEDSDKAFMQAEQKEGINGNGIDLLIPSAQDKMKEFMVEMFKNPAMKEELVKRLIEADYKAKTRRR